MKKCTICLQTKPIAEFNIIHKVLASGERVKRRAAYCRDCNKERSKNRRERLKREGKAKAENKRNYLKAKAKPGYKKRRREIDRAYRARHAEKVREREREYAVIRRRKEGAKSRGPHKRFREKPSSRVYLPIEPLQKYIKEKQRDISLREIATIVGIDPTVLEKIARGTEYRGNGKVYIKKQVSEETVDRVLVGMHEPHRFDELYPREK